MSSSYNTSNKHSFSSKNSSGITKKKWYEEDSTNKPSTSFSNPNIKIRHPPGLKNREIGMFYRNLALSRRNEHGKKKQNTPQIMKLNVNLSEFKEFDIQNTIKSINSNINFSEFQLNSDKFTKYNNMTDSNFKKNFLENIQGSREAELNNYNTKINQNPELDSIFFDELENKLKSDKYNKMLEFRKSLPTFDKYQSIISLIAQNQILVISGETGCGKTTQLAQFILDNEIKQRRGSLCHIICTQPRRISAISVAERVAEERAENLGISVGYQIRLESRFPRACGSILYCTTGILIQRMHTDPALTNVSHLILDEIHERDVLCDFTLALLKDLLPKRPDLKVILMSATLNAERFSKYFNNCPTLNIPGFTFPVQEFYLEDVLEMTRYTPKYMNYRKKYNGWKKQKEYLNNFSPYLRDLEYRRKYSNDVINILKNPESEELDLGLISTLIHHICTNTSDGAILVFLPGWTDISELNDILKSKSFFNNSHFIIIPLHSLMPTATQKSVFKRPPPGVRKIILSTQIAETSVTIDDIEFVINCGKIKINNYDVEHNISTLKPEWVSLANSRQRRGRAGRTRPGVCYHLYNRHRERLLEQYLLPEILRKRLEEVILAAKLLQVGSIASFLNKVMDPPDPRAVECSLELLKSMDALDFEEDLTPLGYHLAKLPLGPQTAKMLLMGALFSCVDPVFSVAASLSFKDPFLVPLNREREVNIKKQKLAKNNKSDHLLLSNTIIKWESINDISEANKFAWDNFLSKQTLSSLSQMKKQFAEYLYNMKFLKDLDPKHPDSNINSNNESLVKAVIASGLYPNITYIHWVKLKKSGIKSKITTKEDGRVYLHPKSINFETTSYESPLLLYHLKLKSSKIFLHDTTMVYPLQILFFGSKLNFQLNENDVNNGILMIQDYQFVCPQSTAEVIMSLKKCMEWLLHKKITNPGYIDWKIDTEEIFILRTISQLISLEDPPQLLPNNYKNEDVKKIKKEENDDDEDDDDDDNDINDGDEEEKKSFKKNRQK